MRKIIICAKHEDGHAVVAKLGLDCNHQLCTPEELCRQTFNGMGELVLIYAIGWAGKTSGLVQNRVSNLIASLEVAGQVVHSYSESKPYYVS